MYHWNRELFPEGSRTEVGRGVWRNSNGDERGKNSRFRVQMSTFCEQLQRVPQTCRVVKGVICWDCEWGLQAQNRENIHELAPEMYFLSHVEFNASIPIFIHLVVKIIYLNIVESSFPSRGYKGHQHSCNQFPMSFTYNYELCMFYLCDRLRTCNMIACYTK